MSVTNPRVDWFFDKDTRWKDAYAKLRAIALECALTEELKWGCPCYTFNGRNVVLIPGVQGLLRAAFPQGCPAEG